MGSIGNKQNADFSKYKVSSVNEIEPISQSSKVDVYAMLSDTLKKAKKAGYEVVPRQYTSVNGGYISHREETYIDTPVKNGKISSNSKLAKHLKDVQSQYDDVIVLQVSPVAPSIVKSRRGSFSNTGNSANFFVLARRK